MFNLSFIVNAAFTIKLPDGVMVAQLILVQFVKVQILVGQPLMVFGRRSWRPLFDANGIGIKAKGLIHRSLGQRPRCACTHIAAG